MMTKRALGAPSPIAVSDAVSRLLRDLVHERTGIYFEPDRFDLMFEKLDPRLHALNYRSHLDYFYHLKYDPNTSEEWHRLMDAFSVQETYFWREFDQIGALVGHIVPEWFGRSDRPLKVWSAACASGEEPFSIAMALEEAGWGKHPIEILASDASEAALGRARLRLYRERSFRALPSKLRQKYFEPQGDFFRLNEEIASRVTFKWANLMSLADFPDCANSQVIFCRNVFIYFSATSIAQVVGSFASRMPPGAPLFLGASESLFKLTTLFDLSQIGSAFVYRRMPPAALP